MRNLIRNSRIVETEIKKGGDLTPRPFSFVAVIPANLFEFIKHPAQAVTSYLKQSLKKAHIFPFLLEDKHRDLIVGLYQFLGYTSQ